MQCLDGSRGELNVYKRLPVTLVRGEGVYVYDDQGKRYLDLYGGHAVATLGYGPTAVTEAISEQARELFFQTNAVDLRNRQLATDALLDSVPKSYVGAFLCNTGAEANENALRLALIGTSRTKVAAIKGAFHGRSAAAGAVTDGNDSWYAFPHSPFEVVWLNPEDPESSNKLEDPEIGAVIFEPVQGVAGAIDLPIMWLDEIQRVCRGHGIVTIADEVQCGVLRTGPFLASSCLEREPDIVTLAKGLGSGFPVGAVLVTEAIAGRVSPGFLGTTFGGGPLACAAIYSTLTEVSRRGLEEHVGKVSNWLKRELDELGLAVQGRGLLLGIKFTKPVHALRHQLLELGYLCGDAKDPNVLRLTPPLIITEDDLVPFVETLRETI